MSEIFTANMIRDLQHHVFEKVMMCSYQVGLLVRRDVELHVGVGSL